ncbi:ATP synthase F1 subunit gamma [Nannocystaceae bacterium ST9]
MANLKEIRSRIASVKNTRKITSAMSRIAAARLRKAQTAMENAREYGKRMATITGEILAELDDAPSHHSLLSTNDLSAICYVIVTADRGLCGGFNSSVSRATERAIKQLRAEGREVHIITVGRKGRAYLKTYKATSMSHHAAPNSPNDVVDAAQAITTEIMGLHGGTFSTADVDGDGKPDVGAGPRVGEVRIVYNYFVNVITQEVRDERLIPLPMPEPRTGGEEPRAAVAHAIRAFEPDIQNLLEHLLPTALETAVQQALYNSVVSEVASRRGAMDAATNNAMELIAELTLQYNRERQAAITKELMEIIGGAEALKG